MGKRMDDWLRNMGDWNISRRRYYGLPLPFYPCSCGQLTVIGSKAELFERATAPVEDLEELRRPWIDEVRIRCEACGAEVERIAEVGDVWLDAGIVPFSTLGWESPEYVPQGYATGAAKGLTTADLPDHAYWEQWFPADWVSEMREQIRLWFYSQLFMSVALTGRAPFRKVLGYEKMLDEKGREMHSSWGNTIDAPDAFARMGADVMRWQYCSQPPNQNLLFGFGPAHEIQRRLLTLWNSCKFLVDYANIDGWEPEWADLEARPERGARAARPLARATNARARQRGHRGLRELAHGGRRPCLRGLHRRRLELVHPALAAPVLGRRHGRSPDALVRARPGASRRRAAHAVPHRSPLARADGAVHGSAGLRPSRRVARRRRAGHRAPCRDRRAAARRRARASGACDVGHEVATAAPRARRRGRAACRESCRRGRGRAPRPRGLVRAGRGKRAPCEAESPAARAEARQGARCCARGASVRRLRGALRRRHPRRGSRPHARRGAWSSGRARTAGRLQQRTVSLWRSTCTSTTSSSAPAACTT